MSDRTVPEATGTRPDPVAAAATGFLVLAGTASAIAGLAHYAAAAQHLPGQTWAALLFTLIGAFQLVWPALPGYRHGARRVLLAGIVVHAAALLGWLLTRTVALPFGHHAGEVQPVGVLDAGTALAELVVVVAAVAALRRLAGPRRPDPTG